jgi:hypothetical protein
MTFTDFLRNKSGLTTFSAKSVTESFLDVYLWSEFPDRGTFLKDKDKTHVNGMRDTCIADMGLLGAGPPKQGRLMQLVTDLDNYAVELGVKLGRRLQKSQTEKEGRVALANAQTPVPIDVRIGGDRVLHFTTAFAPIVTSKKLRISATSDQGCLFCIPARYAGQISLCPPSEVKQLFDIRQDLSYYLEFNLENSRTFESYNSNISKELKGQKELKIHSEILNLDRRDPTWYEWKGKSQGGWQIVPGPYNWGK